MTTRFPNGLTTTTSTTTLGNFIMPDPTTAHVFFDDFDTYVAGDWTVTETGTATQALTDADGGVLLITNAALDNDASFSQKVGESFLFEAGKKLWFKARFTASAATESDIVIGLQITDTTPLDVSDGVFFLKADDAATISFLVEKNGTASTASAIATLTAATMMTVGFYYNGKDAVDYFVDDVKLGSLPVTNLPDDEVLTITYGMQNGSAGAKTMSVDYIMVAKER
jgi:hypothetical protein